MQAYLSQAEQEQEQQEHQQQEERQQQEQQDQPERTGNSKENNPACCDGDRLTFALRHAGRGPYPACLNNFL